MSDNNRTLQILRRRMVAIISVLLALVLVTTITFNSPVAVWAEGEEDAQTEETVQTEGGEGQEGAAEGTDNGEGTAGGEDNGDGAAADAAASDDISIDDLLGTDDSGSTGLNIKASMPEVSSDSYIVMSGSTSEVVLEKNPERKLQPGKITMLVTAMVAIDNMYNEEELKNTVEITSKLAEYGDTYKEGETVSVGDLLKAMLTGGDQQSAEAIASYSASKRKIFISEMNSKAMELGLMDSYFSNPRGAYSTKMYSTAADLAVVMQAAYRYPLIREALELRSFTATAASKSGSRKITFRNTNILLVSGRPSDIYKLSKGGLMGTLTEPETATQYAGVAVIDDMQLIVILMDSKESAIPYETKGLFEYANTLVTRNVVIEEGKKVGHVRVRGGSRTRVAAYTEAKGFAYVPPEGSEDLVTTEAVLYDNIEAPLKGGDKVGEYRIYVADELKGTVNLIVRSSVPTGWLPSQIYISNFLTVVIGVILLLILLFILRVQAVKRRRKRLRAERRERRLRELALQQMEMDEDRRRRNWTVSTSYEKVAPRTGDLRKEAIEAEIRKERAKTGSGRKTGSSRKTGKNKKQDTGETVPETAENSSAGVMPQENETAVQTGDTQDKSGQ